MNGLTHAHWIFGGPLSGAPSEPGWILLGSIGGIAAVSAWISYRTAVTRLGFASAALLTLLRTTAIAVVLLCLANPISTEVTEVTLDLPSEDASPRQERLAVVVDQSDSMTIPDNRGSSRQDDALNRWSRFEKAAGSHFNAIDYYHFAATLKSTTSLKETRQRSGKTDTTHLHESLRRLVNTVPEKRPSAILTLTDGLDTAPPPSGSAALIAEANAASIPLYFIAGTNRSGRPAPYFRVRDLQVPATAFQSTEFFIEATLEAFSRSERSVRLSLWQNERQVSVETINLSMGTTVVPWKKSVRVDEAETVAFSLRWGETLEEPVIARGATRVMAPKERLINVLVFQNGLDWGMRHLTDAVRSDPNYKLVTLLSTDLGLTLARSTDNDTRLHGQLPTEVKALSLFDCILLFQVTPVSLSAAQQNALVDFTRQGGALIVINPPDAVASGFSQSPLGAVLPVVFHSPEEARTPFTPNTQLQPFVLTEQGSASSVFSLPGSPANPGLVPRFASFAPATQAKPGADVLAVHPTLRDSSSGKPYILAATQIFGRGRCTVLTTDSLWRWKMSEPSTSSHIATFWQQLLSAYSRRAEPPALQFIRPPATVVQGTRQELTLTSPAREPSPRVIARSPDNREITLELVASGTVPSSWTVEWPAEQVGMWQIIASQQGSVRSFIFPEVTARVTGELADAPPDREHLSYLASQTGGAILDHTVPLQWIHEAKTTPPPQKVSQTRTDSLWNTPLVLTLALGVYLLELTLRRVWRLI